MMATKQGEAPLIDRVREAIGIGTVEAALGGRCESACFGAAVWVSAL